MWNVKETSDEAIRIVPHSSNGTFIVVSGKTLTEINFPSRNYSRF